jgi:hypothetical protein
MWHCPKSIDAAAFPSPTDECGFVFKVDFKVRVFVTQL